MKVNNKNCIMLSQLYDVYQFQEDDEVKIIINLKGYELTVNE